MITHTSGDELEGEHVVITVDGEPVEDQFDGDSFVVGDSVMIDDVPGGTVLELVYDDGSTAAVLVSTEIRR